jgi:hypothetical protein
MEKHKHYNDMHGMTDGWEAWDAVPRDGPAVFVIDTVALDQHHQFRGRWLDLAAGAAATEAALGDLLGRPIDAGWAIVDQIGLGPRMAPEALTLEDLRHLPQLPAAEEPE